MESPQPVMAPDQPGASFETFCQTDLAWAQQLSFVLTGDRHAAEDIAQEALVRIYGRFDTLESPHAYLRVVIVNLCRRHRGRKDRHDPLPEDDDAWTPRVSPESTELLELIDSLPSRQRAVLVLRYFEDLTESQIALALSCRPGTVKSLASRALRRLQKELDK